MFAFNPFMSAFSDFQKMNPMCHNSCSGYSNPVDEFMKNCCFINNHCCNPMMNFYKNMMNCFNSSHCSGDKDCNSNQSMNFMNKGHKNCCFGFSNGFNLYPMMMEKLMKMMSDTYYASCTMSHQDCKDHNSCNTDSCNDKDHRHFHSHSHCDSSGYIKRLECWSNSWAENFGKLHGEMMKFNEQAVNYIKLISENIKVMKEQVCDSNNCDSKKTTCSSSEGMNNKKK